MRTWLYGVLSNSADLAGVVAARIYPANVQFATPETPYVVFKIAPEIPRIGGAARQTECQIWGHDTPDNYDDIDRILAIIKRELEAQSTQDKFMAAEWIEDSEDLFDDATGTILRYSRYQLINTP